MRVSKVVWGRTASKNYQSQRAEFEIEIEPGEDHQTALALAKALVTHALGEGPSAEEVERAETIAKRAREQAELVGHLSASVK